MWEAIIEFLRSADLERRQAKLGALYLVYDLFILMAIQFLIALATKELLSPWIAVVGLVWIVATVIFIWKRGGVVADSLVIAKIAGLKVGDVFVGATLIFIMLHVLITSFFLLVPFWKFLPGFFAILLALVGWGISSYFSKAEFQWKEVRKFYIGMLISMVAIIFLFASYEFVTGKDFVLDAFRTELLKSGVGVFIMIGIVLLILSMIVPKGKSALKAIGGALIFLPLMYALFWSDAKTTTTKLIGGDGKPKARSEEPERAPTEKSSQKIEEETITLAPWQKAKETGLWVNRGDSIRYFQPEGQCFWIANRSIPDEEINTPRVIREALSDGEIQLSNNCGETLQLKVQVIHR